MADWIRSFLADLSRQFRLADALDILLVAVMAYALLNWVRRSASRPALVAAAILAAIYLAADALDMYLTRTLLQALVVLLVIATIVVFQNDIRRMVDQLGEWALRQRSRVRTPRTPEGAQSPDIVTNAVSRMADERVGALLAIRGVESWDRHLSGGVPLEGTISEPLLRSIFSPESPGHDGAVLFESDRVLRFGVMLPLSDNLAEIGPRGTRHAAALGLAERTDALVVVVSEESGTISVAQGGRLRPLRSAAELKPLLDAFWREHHEPKRTSFIARLGEHGLQNAAIALVIAVALWFFVAQRTERVFRTYVVPIEFRGLPPDQALLDPVPVEARVTLAGSEQAFRLLDPAALVISLDLARIEEGENELTVGADSIQLPSDIELYRVEPQVVPVEATRLREVRAILEPQLTGELPPGLELAGVRVQPARVLILVDEVNGPGSVSTEPIDLSVIEASGPIETRLILPEGARLRPEQSPEVTVLIEVQRSEADQPGAGSP